MKSKKAAKKASIRFISPMLAKLVDEPFSKKGWFFETKFDGIRCIAVKKNKKVSLYSRNKKLLNGSFPEIVNALEKNRKDNFVLDGEIVTFDKKITSFSKLQPRIHKKNPSKELITQIKVYYYLFDLLMVNGADIRNEPLIKRKKELAKFTFVSPLRKPQVKLNQGKVYFSQAKKLGWEGIIGKEAQSHYHSKRSSQWQKIKCENNQEFIIIGFTDPQHSRIGFGAILLGYYHNHKLHYAGKVGTGFDTDELKRLHKRFLRLERVSCPVKEKKIREKNAHWIQPKLVAQISFTEWTKDGKLRHPRYLGLRTDKPAKQVKNT